MKSLIWIIVLSLHTVATAHSMVTEAQIPANVSARFHYQFPAAKEARWEKSAQYYKASYEESGKNVVIYYTESGDCVEIDREVTTAELPDNIITQLNTAYVFEKIIAIDDFSGTPYYLVEVSKGDKQYTYEFESASQDLILYDIKQGVVVW